MTLTCDQVRDLAAGYVLDALDPGEAADVRGHLDSCAQPHPEFAELGGVVPAFAENVDLVEPPSGLKARIMAAAAADLEVRRAGAPDLAGGRSAMAPMAREAGTPVDTAATGPRSRPADAPVAFPGPAERAVRQAARTSRATWLARIAAVVAIAALGGWNVLLQGRVAASDRYADGVAAVLDVAVRSGSQTAILSAPEGDGSRGIAAIAADGAVVIAMRDMAPTTGTQVYETWVIHGTDAPIAIGGFTVAADGTGTFRVARSPATAGIVIALTREPAPGSTTPMGPVVSKGVASAPPS